jgi:hypothetical protein
MKIHQTVYFVIFWKNCVKKYKFTWLHKITSVRLAKFLKAALLKIQVFWDDMASSLPMFITDNSAFNLNHRRLEPSKYVPHLAILNWFIYTVMVKDISWMGVKCIAVEFLKSLIFFLLQFNWFKITPAYDYL